MFVAEAFAQTTDPHAVAQGAEGQAGTEVPAGEAHGSSFPPFDTTHFPSQLLWLAITFGLFYIFLKRVALPRIGGILEVRRDRIAHDLDTAARMKEEADEAVAAYEQELADARARSNSIAQEARDKAKAEADVERRKAEDALNAKLAEAEGRISALRASALKDVGAIAESTATEIVRSLVGGSADKAAVAAAVKAAG